MFIVLVLTVLVTLFYKGGGGGGGGDEWQKKIHKRSTTDGQTDLESGKVAAADNGMTATTGVAVFTVMNGDLGGGDGGGGG